jgi:hypothetical protein
MAVAEWGVMLVVSDEKRSTDCPICTVTALFPGKDSGLRLVNLKGPLAEFTGPVQFI